MKGFIPLRTEAEKRGNLIKEAGDRKASPQEACKLIGNFGKAEVKMIKYIEANAAKCGIPQQVADQLKKRPQEHRGHVEAGLRGGAAGAAKRLRPVRA